MRVLKKLTLEVLILLFWISNVALTQADEVDQLISTLTEHLKVHDRHVRVEVVKALGRIGDIRVIEPLAAVLMEDEYRAVQTSAAYSLARLGEPAIKPLIAALGHRDSHVRSIAAGALARIGKPAVEPLISALKHGNNYVREGAVEALGRIGDIRAVKLLITALNDEHSVIRWRAAEALSKIGDPRAVEPFTIALKDKEYNVRLEAAEALGRIGDIRAVKPLITALNDEHWVIRWRAAEALGKIGDPRAVEPLAIALKDKKYNVRLAAVYSISKINKPTVETFITTLKEEDYNLRQEVVEALAKMKGPQTVEPLITALKDKYYSVRMHAAEALGRIGDIRAAEPLIAALKDKNLYVRVAAARALDELGWKAENKSEKAFYLIVRQDWDKCLKIGEPAIEPLIIALKGDCPAVRYKAVNILAKLGDARAVNSLIVALRDERYPPIRASSAEALGRIKDLRAVEPLIVALRDENASVRKAAAISLGEIGDSRTTEPLVTALKDKDGSVRWRVAEALTKLNHETKDISKILVERTKVCIGKFTDISKKEVLLNELDELQRNFNSVNYCIELCNIQRVLEPCTVEELFLDTLKTKLSSAGFEVEIVENAISSCEIKIDGVIKVKEKIARRIQDRVNIGTQFVESMLGERQYYYYVKLPVIVNYSIDGKIIKKKYTPQTKKDIHVSSKKGKAKEQAKLRKDLIAALAQEISSEIVNVLKNFQKVR